MSETTTEKTELGWCVLELFGRRRLAGYVTETEVAGKGFLRVDVPELGATEAGPWYATQLYSPDAFYGITPTTRDVAVRAAQSCRPEPVSRWDLPALAAGERLADDGAEAGPEDDSDESAEWDDPPEF